jgi:putative SOS response-associated peptidase YedK
MCGRFGRRADKQRIAEWMQTHNTDVFDDSYLAPSYNVAPQSFQPVVRLDSETGERELTVMRWGLVPFWAKDVAEHRLYILYTIYENALNRKTDLPLKNLRKLSEQPGPPHSAWAEDTTATVGGAQAEVQASG